MASTVEYTFWTRAVPIAILAVSLGALAAAFAAEHLFGLKPCILCIYERVPYAAAGLLAGATLVLPMTRTMRSLTTAGCAVIFFAGAALASYHVGVEEHWWSSIAGCGGELAMNLTVENLRAQIASEPLKPCDQADGRLFGLSLAGYNMLASLVLAIACLASLRFFSQRRGP